MSRIRWVLVCLCSVGWLGSPLVGPLPAAAGVSFRTAVKEGDPDPDVAAGATIGEFWDPAINDRGEIVFSGRGYSPWHTGAWLVDETGLHVIARDGMAAPETGETFGTMAYIADLDQQGHVVLGTRTAEGNLAGVWKGRPGELSLVALEGQPAPGTASAFHGFPSAPQPVIGPGGTVLLRGSADDGYKGGWWSDRAGSLAPIAYDGDPAADLPNGYTYISTGRAVRNRDGAVAFLADYDPPGPTSGVIGGIWVEKAGTLRLVAETGGSSAAPGEFTHFHSLSFNNRGEAATLAVTAGTGRGIWVDTDGGMTKVAAEGDRAPGTEAGVTFGDFPTSSGGDFAPVLSNLGQVAFYAEVEGPGVTEENEGGIWSTVSGELEMVIRAGDRAPGTPAGVVFRGGWMFDDGARSLSLNDRGDLVFYAFVDGPGIDGSNNDGIWALADGEVILLAREGDTIEVDPGVFATIDRLTCDDVLGCTSGMTQRGCLNERREVVFAAEFTDKIDRIVVATIPEPATVLLLAAAAAVLRRRRGLRTAGASSYRWRGPSSASASGPRCPSARPRRRPSARP